MRARDPIGLKGERERDEQPSKNARGRVTYFDFGNGDIYILPSFHRRLKFRYRLPKNKKIRLLAMKEAKIPRSRQRFA